MATTLTARQGRILKHTIEEYVVTAQPVSSETLVRKYEPSVSSATVRNEMATLQDAGLLHHPHASSGRVPSDTGYRHYLDYLMGDVRLSQTEERTILHQFHQVESEVGEWTRLAGAVLSSLVQTPVVVMQPVAHTPRLRCVDFVPIGEGNVLVVAILRSGAVRQQLVRVGGSLAMDRLTQLSFDWNDELVGKSAQEIRELPPGAAYHGLIDTVVRLLEGEEDNRQSGDLHVEGLSYMATQPEFGTPERLQPVVELLERRGALDVLFEPVFESQGVRVSIGQEQPLEGLRDCSAVLSAYGRPGEMVGVVGVIGPTRLPYWRAVPLVECVAGMLERLLEGTFLL